MFYSPWQRRFSFVGRFLAVGMLIWIPTLSLSHGSDDWKLSFGDRFSNSGGEAKKCAAFSPDGKLVAICCRDNSIRLWDMTAGRELRRLVGHTRNVTQLQFSPDGKRILSAASQEYPPSSFRIWSVATGEMLFHEKSPPKRTDGIAWHPDGRRFAAMLSHYHSNGAAKGNYVEEWDAQTFKPLRRFISVPTAADRLMYSSDGQRLLVSGIGSSHAGILLQTRTGRHQPLPNSLRWVTMSADGAMLAGTDRDGNIVILDADQMTEIRRVLVPKNHESLGRLFRTNGLGLAIFHPDGRSVFTLYSGIWTRWNLETGELLQWQTGSGSTDSILEIAPDGRLLLQAAGSRTVLVRNLADRQLIARFHLFSDDGAWATDTPSGYFHCSDKVTPKLDYRARRELGDSFLEQHNRPVIVSRLLGGMALEEALQLPEHGQPPTVQIQLVEVRQEEMSVRVQARCLTAGGGIRSISIRVDGREIRSPAAKGLVIERSEMVAGSESEPSRQDLSVEQTITVEIPFPAGKNDANIDAIAVDSFGQRSQVESVSATRPRPVRPIRGRLFVLAVGVSEYDNPALNLQYCHADAEALTTRFLKEKGRTFRDVQVQTYTDRQATVTNVKEGLAWLQRSCTEQDVAVLLFSGHGVQKERGLYYCTHETNIEGLQYTALNWETVAETLRDTKARQILFLADACHAGAFGDAELAPQRALAETLRDAAGVMFFASSAAREISLEDSRWGHGAFCKAILDGLEGKADTNGDGRISIRELSEYVCREVPVMTNGKQHPEIPDLGRYDPNLILVHCEPIK